MKQLKNLIQERLHINKNTVSSFKVDSLDNLADKYDLTIKWSAGSYVLNNANKIFNNPTIKDMIEDSHDYAAFIHNMQHELDEYLLNHNDDYKKYEGDLVISISRVSAKSQLHLNLVSSKMNSYVGYLTIGPEKIVVNCSNVLYNNISIEKILVQTLEYLLTK